MTLTSIRGTLLNIPLLEEKYGLAFLASVVLHVALALFLVLVPFLLPRTTPLPLGGPGGGPGGEVFTVGVADELAGGTGMTKPSLVPQPPPLPEEKAEKTPPKPDAIALPQTLEKKPPTKIQRKAPTASSQKAPETKQSNVIPTAPEAGAGGTGGIAGGSGGGRGGGTGVSIGAGSGGLGDSWYARVVESRISSNWIRPPEGVRCDIVYGFYIALNGSIYNIKLMKSSGNSELDMTAERAIRASNPLAPPPPEFRGREIQFVAEFIYPPNQ
jgi:TonB family protein